MKIVLAHGCFDILHYGHLVHLQEARQLGDMLVVSVTEDAYVNKGPDRPMFNVEQRMAMLRVWAIIDSVISSKSAEEAINKIKPHVYVKGKEYARKLPEKKLVESYGGRVVFTDGPINSSTDLIARAGGSIPSYRDWGRNPR